MQGWCWTCPCFPKGTFITIYGSNDDSTVLIDDTDLLAICVPAHTPNNWLVPVVDHLFVPWPWHHSGKHKTHVTFHWKSEWNALICHYMKPHCNLSPKPNCSGHKNNASDQILVDQTRTHLCRASIQWWGHFGHWWWASGTVHSRWQLALLLCHSIQQPIRSNVIVVGFFVQQIRVT